MVKDEHHDGDYGNEQWMVDDYHSQHTHSPNHEYAVYGYMSSSHMPMPAYNRSMSTSYPSHQQPPPLITAQWPSMLTNPPSNASSPLQTQASSGPPPLAPLAPLTTYNAHPPLPPVAAPIPTPNTRRTLTDQDRRRMCQYHEENPTVKQTEIGGT